MNTSTPTVFDHPSGWSLNVIEVNGEPWFLAPALTAALGYSNGRDAIGTHVDQEDRNTVVISDGNRGNPNKTIINESGLYALILGSKLPAAREFKRWVTSEVLPSIRRTGSYATPPAMPTHSEALRGWADSIDRAEAAERALEAAKPDVEFVAKIVADKSDYSIRDAAQALSADPMISTGLRRLMQTLRAIGWIDRNNVPYQAQVENGRMVQKVTEFLDRDGERRFRVTPRITPKGLRQLHERLGGTAQLVLMGGA